MTAKKKRNSQDLYSIIFHLLTKIVLTAVAVAAAAAAAATAARATGAVETVIVVCLSFVGIPNFFLFAKLKHLS